MSVWDRLMGTRQPAPGVSPVDAAVLRAGLFALNRADAAWRIRPGTLSDCADVVAEWNAVSGSAEYYYNVFIRLDEADRTACAVDTFSSISGAGGAGYMQGNVFHTSSTWDIERDENGKRRFVKKSEFDTRVLKDLLRDTVTTSGWRWKGRVRRR